jgi:hypothetical protein
MGRARRRWVWVLPAACALVGACANSDEQQVPTGGTEGPAPTESFSTSSSTTTPASDSGPYAY